MKKLFITFIFISCCNFIYSQLVSTSNFDTLTTFLKKELATTDAKIYLCGERHKQTANPFLHKCFIEALHEVKNVKNILLEYPASYIYLIEKKIKKEPLSDIFNTSRITENYTLQKCYSYEKKITQDNSKNITLWGVDREFRSWVPFLVLKDLQPANVKIDKKIEASFLLIDEILNKNKLPSSKKLLEACLLIKNNLDSNEALYKYYLKDNFYLFRRIVKGLVIGLKYPVKTDKLLEKNFAYREQLMYNNINELMHLFPDEIFFGYFGTMHVSKTLQEDWLEYSTENSFATMLQNNDNSLAKNKVISIAYYYDSDYNLPEPAEEYYNHGLFNQEIRKKLYEETKKKITFYKVKDIEGCTKDYSKVFDYYLIYKPRTKINAVCIPTEVRKTKKND